MATLAWILGSLGGLAAVIGVVTAAGAMPPLGAEFTTMFWLTLGAVLLLGSIAAAVGAGNSYE